MDRLHSHGIYAYNHGYCSQGSLSLPPIQSIEKCMRIIEEILGKEILCRHNVIQMNQVYQTMDDLECSVIAPNANSLHALEKIIQKITTIVQSGRMSAKDLISFYHLRNFVEHDLPIGVWFTNSLSKFQPVPTNIEEIARLLPCCQSEDLFNDDVNNLIRSDMTEKASAILDQKRKKLRDYERITQEIAEARVELAKVRLQAPEKYPAYLDELLDCRAIHLYKHLIDMRSLPTRSARRAEIERMSFSQVAHIVLETRNSIVRKVENCLPATCCNVLFLLGGSGAGKSTSLCFLRGDVMMLDNFEYRSRSNRNHTIGHEGATSCTFLPTIEIVNDLAIVDFPGFDDTNGPIVSMGMEFALKALIKKLRPRVLVFESITNINSKFAAAAQLGARLKRLFSNKEDCLLGITKYSRDPDYAQIKAIEEQQRRDLTESSEEKALVEVIRTLSLLNLPALQDTILQKQAQLAAIQQANAQNLQSLPDTNEKIKSRAAIKEREEGLLSQIGLGRVVRFSELEKHDHLLACYAALDHDVQAIRVADSQRLEAGDEALLYHLFVNNLQKEMDTKIDYSLEFDGFSSFEQSILETSLINTMFSQCNPEIGQFLHLPEMDSDIVRRYDKEVVRTCIEKYMKSVICELNTELIDSLLKEYGKKAPQIAEKLNAKVLSMQTYILGLLGYQPKNEEQTKAEWARIQKAHQEARKMVDEKYTFPLWAKILLGVPLGIPYGIVQLNWHYALNHAAAPAKCGSCCL